MPDREGMASKGRIRSFSVVAGALVALATSATAAQAGQSREVSVDPQARSVSPQVRQVAGARTKLTDVGLYRVRPDVGPALYTHGPDPIPEKSHSRLARQLPDEVGFSPKSVQRPPVCAEANSQHILYARTAAAADRLASLTPNIQAAMRRTNAVLNAESLDSGGPTADYRVRCDGAGEIDVGSIVTTGPSMSEIVSAARTAGYDSQVNDYLVFFDGQVAGCGIASMRADERLSADNLNNSGGAYAVVYQGCWYEDTPMHESGHLMGAVQYGAPNSTGTGGHCYDEDDVLCYAPDGGNLHQDGTSMECDTWFQPRFDCNHDDYFDSAPEPGEYLETHWNLGSPLNAYIAFDAGGPSDPYDEDGTGTWRRMPIQVPSKTQSVSVSLHARGDLSLYLRRAHAPTETRFACRARPKPGVEKCELRNPRHGQWVVAVLEHDGKAAGAIEVKTKLKLKREANGPRSQTKSRVWRPRSS